MGWASIRTERKNQQWALLCDAAPLAVLGAGQHPSSQDGAQRSRKQLPYLCAAAAQPLSICSIGAQSRRGPVLGDSGLDMNTMSSRGLWQWLHRAPAPSVERTLLSLHDSRIQPARQTDSEDKDKGKCKKGGVGGAKAWTSKGWWRKRGWMEWVRSTDCAHLLSRLSLSFYKRFIHPQDYLSHPF